MPYEGPEPGDPQELVGVMAPAGPGATREMAYVFAEEFARLGLSRQRILAMFRHPFYAGAHRAYRTLGASAIAQIVDECLEVWGRVRLVDREPAAQRQGPARESRPGRARS